MVISCIKKDDTKRMKITDYFKPVKQETNFNLLPDGVFTLEHDGKIIDVNDKILQMYNTTKYDLLGKYFSDCVENGTAILNEIIKTKEYVCAKAKVKDDVAPLVLEISTIKSEENQRVYVCARNMTTRQREFKSMSEKYNVAQRIIDEKNEFLLNSSGALLSSLVSIAGFSRALLDGIGGALSDKQEKYLSIINSTSKDLNYDLEKLFTLFRVESEKQDYIDSFS